MSGLNGLTIVSTVEGRHAVWHVSLGLVDPTGRRRGGPLAWAWLLPQDTTGLQNFAVGRVLLADDIVGHSLQTLASETLAVQDRLNVAFQAWRDTEGKRLVLRWHAVAVLDLAEPGAFGTPSAMRVAMARAMWAQCLISAWSDPENKRVVRQYLLELGGPLPCDLPPDWLHRWSNSTPGIDNNLTPPLAACTSASLPIYFETAHSSRVSACGGSGPA